MMKKRLLFLLLAGLLCLTGCSQASANQEPAAILDEETTDDEETQSETEEDDENGQADGEEEDGQQNPADSEVNEPEDEKPAVPDAQPAVITVYYSNDDATAFETEKIEIRSLTPEAVLDTLVEKGMIVADIEILSLETAVEDGKNTIEIDFNDAFSSYISNMGSTGEYYVMGSICNTFLSAYDCEQIKITVEGKTLETGHAEYPGYMAEFS